jgi:excisionase family DNA binding protein
MEAIDDACGGLTFCTFGTYDNRLERSPGVALSRSDAETIRAVVLRLRAEHADREAAAIERLMQQAVGSPDTTAALDGYMTTGEAAGLIGVTLQTVKNWVGRGRLVGSRVGGRTLVTRASVQAFFDTLSSAPDEVESGDSGAAEIADRELMASLPESLIERVETLLERARSGRKLSPSERRELRRLAHAGTTAATRRTRDLVSRRRPA